MYQLYTAIKFNDEVFKKQFLKEVSGTVKIPAGKHFAFGMMFLYIHQWLRENFFWMVCNLKDDAIKTYNKEKKKWSWKLI